MELEQTEMDDIQKIKVVFLGDRSVGKSSIVKRLIRNQFDSQQNPTVCIDYMSKNVQYRGRRYKLELWDTAGQEKYRSLVKSYLKEAHCAVFVYDVNSAHTYSHITDWLRIFRQTTSKDSLCLVIGNKVDLVSGDNTVEPFIRSKELEGLQHCQVSAKEGKNIGELFRLLMETVTTTKILTFVDLPSSGKKLLEESKPNSSRCCGKGL